MALYNSPSDAKPLGAQFTDSAGNFKGRGALPSDYRRYTLVEVSREDVGTHPTSPTHVVLNGITPGSRRS